MVNVLYTNVSTWPPDVKLYVFWVFNEDIILGVKQTQNNIELAKDLSQQLASL